MKAPLPNSYWVVPGSLLAGEYPGARSREAAGDKLGQLLDAGVDHFIDLTTKRDPLEPYEKLLLSEASERGKTLTYTRRSVRDLGCPAPEEMKQILDDIDAAIANGRRVYVHCWGGVGRTGTVVGCYLVRRGRTGEAALEELTRLYSTMSAKKVAAHPMSPETPAQRDFVLGWRERQSRRDQSHFRGCLLGGAVGDALGAPVEFLDLEQIRRRFGPKGIRNFAAAYGHVGAITDDTQMTLFTAEGLLRAAVRQNEKGICHVPSVVFRAYERWLHTQGRKSKKSSLDGKMDGWLVKVPELQSLRAPGNTCLAALIDGDMGSPENRINDSKGCGAVMRAAPVGLVSDNAFALGCEIGALTHGHPSGYLSAGALAEIIHLLVDGSTLEEAVEGALVKLRESADSEECVAVLERAVLLAVKGPVNTESIRQLGLGWVGEEALAISVCCALVAQDDFARGVRLAVNHDGDSDSTGAITGNILGVMLGSEAIPKEWLKEVELREEISTLADDLLGIDGAGEQWWDRYPGW